MEQDESVQQFQMVELIPGDLRRFESGKDSDSEDQEAPHDCSLLQQQAYEEGKKNGYDEGVAQSRQELQGQFQHALELANRIGKVRVAALEEQERDIVEVAMAIAKKVLKREIEHDSATVVRQVQQLLGLLHKKSLVTLRVNPNDIEELRSAHEVLGIEGGKGEHLILEADEDIEVGGCVIEQGGLLLDARIHQQLDVLAKDFGLEPTNR